MVGLNVELRREEIDERLSCRSLYEAARAGAVRAGAAGATRVVLALQPHPRFPRAELVVLLGALEAFYAVSAAPPNAAHSGPV